MLKIHIDRLTLEGASRSDAVSFSDSLRAHLTRLLAPGISPAAPSVKSLDAGEVPAGAMDRAGRQTAQRIVSHLSPASKGGRRG